MRKILAILFSIISFSALACVCDPPSITEKYIESDFVAIVTITKNYPNEKNSNIYRADIKIDELFKGEKLKSIYVYGRSDNNYDLGTSCDIFIPVNTKLVVYAHKDSNANYVVGMCSGLLYLNKNRIEYQKNELAILNTFKSKKINFTDKTKYLETSNFSIELEKHKGIQLQKTYAIFEITFASDLAVKGIEKISGFDNPVDDELVDVLSKTKWSIRNRQGLKNEVKYNRKLLVGFYYYKAEKGYKSFISIYYL